MRRRHLILLGVTLILAGGMAPATAGAAVTVQGALADLRPLVADPTDGGWTTATVSGAAGAATVVLNVKGMNRAAAGTTLGAHVHVGPCRAGDGAAAGPHFNIDVWNGVIPPAVSPTTEVWLDFTIPAGGTGHAIARVPLEIPDGAASSIVIHALPTAPDGAAGPRLACIGLPS